MNLKESGEMYLESIYILTKKDPHVHSINVCEYMGFSKPSVSRAVGLLKKGGYITVSTDGHIALTDMGREVAEKIYSRHEVITKLLTKIGVSPELAARDACRIEHVISDESFEAIRKIITED